MRITYLAHSGFIVTTSEVVMVFDYYRDYPSIRFP